MGSIGLPTTRFREQQLRRDIARRETLKHACTLFARYPRQVTSGILTMAFALLGLGLGALGVPLALGRVPPNGSYGFRTPKTLSSPDVWYAANRIQGIDLCVAGPAISVSTVVLFLAWRRADVALLALTDAGIMTAALVVAAGHSFVELRRL